MIHKSLIIILITFILCSCTKKQESLAKIETMPVDSLISGEASDEILDEFEYEADSLQADENEE
jgi:hypothetical protein